MENIMDSLNVLSIAVGVIIMGVSCERRTETASNTPDRAITDTQLVGAYEDWKAGNIAMVSELIDRLGEPMQQDSKNGMTTYSWSGTDEYWLFAGVNIETGYLTGVSVQSRY